MAVSLKLANGRTIPIVRSHAEHAAAKSYALKMKVDSLRNAADGIVGNGMRAMRQLMDCSPDDMAHKSLHSAIKEAITHSAMARHDAGYYNDSTAADSVETSSAAAKCYTKCMNGVKAMNCAKCADHMKALGQSLKYGIDLMSENAGEDVAEDDENPNDASTGYQFKRLGLYVPDTVCAFGQGVKKIGDRRYGGYLVRFTGPDKTDAEGEYFDKETDFMIGVFPIKGAMSLYNHGLDRSVGSCPIGTVVATEVKSDGIYIETEVDFLSRYKTYVTALEAPPKWKAQQLAMASQYDRIIQEMLDDGRLGWSSGAHTPSVVKSKTGHIDRWPIIEASATPIPAMPFETKIQPVKNLIALGQLQNARGVAA